MSELCSGDYPEPVIFRPAGWEQQPCCQGQGAWGTQKGNNLTSRNFRCSGENSESLSTGIKKKKCINCDNPDIGKIAEDQLKRWRCRILQKLIIFWYHIEPSGTFWLFTFFSRLLFEYPRMKTPVANGKMFRFIICPPFSATIFKLCKSSSKC